MDGEQPRTRRSRQGQLAAAFDPLLEVDDEEEPDDDDELDEELEGELEDELDEEESADEDEPLDAFSFARLSVR